MTTAATGLLCLLGDPVAHSLSPQLHTAALAACGIDAVYVACRVHDVQAAVDGLHALGALGANVTVPHKRAVWEHVDRRTSEAELIGAANTLFRDGGGWMADNTDAEGVRRVLADDVGVEANYGVVVFGAGGAARAVAVAIVNATPLGLHGERLPERYHRLADGQAVLDLVYGPTPTPFVADARARGLPAWDGLGMLVGQAAAAFERWTGRAAPVDVMRAAATVAVGR
jgi:shikimate dehydrogenase